MKSFGWAWSAVVSVAAARTIVPYDSPDLGALAIQGFYADPDIRLYNGTYWIFPTTSIDFKDQTYFDAFSSPDLATWTKHANLVTASDFTWARDNFWAPASVQRNGQYYFYFSANGLRTLEATAGLGVAVASSPGGPYHDALGERLIGEVINNANPMDADIFVDDDHQAYLYYGGTAVNVALLADDMVSFKTLPDEQGGGTFKDVTPAATFVEGTEVFTRNGIYYMTWSENGYGDPTYQVAYGMADSPFGPFRPQGVILQQDAAVAVATGHNSVLNLPGTDTWYMAYHRRPLTETAANNRVLALDLMYFNEDGTIQPIQISA